MKHILHEDGAISSFHIGQSNLVWNYVKNKTIKLHIY